MAFQVTFGSVSLPGVRSIQRGAAVSPSIISNTTSNVGQRKREITVDGIIFSENQSRTIASKNKTLTTYDTLENDLTSAGLATLSFGNQSFTNCRMVDINFDQFSNTPAIFYSVKFLCDSINPFAETVTLQDSNGTTTFDPIPQVSDDFIRQDPTIAWSTQGTSAAKIIKLSGRFIGTTAQITTIEDEIKSRCTTFATMTLTVPTGAYTVKCTRIVFSTPHSKDFEQEKTYEIDFITEKNYSLESENLPHTSVVFAGVSLSILKSYNSQIQRKNDNGTYRIESESLSIGGEIHFSSFAAAEAYQATVKSQATTPQTILSTTGLTLVCQSISFSAPTREGRDTSGNQKYILDIQMNFEWLQTEQDACVGAGETIFGITWDCINSKSYSGSVNFCGLKTQDTITISGITSTIPSVEIGSSRNYLGKTYYVTGLSLNGRDKQGRYSANISARTLDTLETAIQFVTVTLPLTGAVINELNNYSRSQNQRYSAFGGGYRTTSVTISISGNIYVGNGNANALLDVIQEFNTFAVTGLNTLRVTSVSIGAKQSYVDKDNCQIGYKQQLSISYIINFEPDGSGGSGGEKEAEEINIVEEESVEIQQIRNKYQQIQIPGGTLFFKKVGVEPGKYRSTKSRRRVGGDATKEFDFPEFPSAPAGPSDMILVDERKTSSGTTRSAIVEYLILKGTISSVNPGNGRVVSSSIG